MSLSGSISCSFCASLSSACVRAPGLFFATGNFRSLVLSHSNRSAHLPAAKPPLGENVCRPQKHAVELFSSPSNSRCESSLVVGGSLMTGADCLNTLPPRSKTKWLWVATKAKEIDSGVRNLSEYSSCHSYHVSPRSSIGTPKRLLLEIAALAVHITLAVF